METQAKHGLQQDTDLTHREAVLVLRRTDYDTHSDDLDKDAQAAFDHYMPTVAEDKRRRDYAYDCKQCARHGVGEILGLSFTCKEAIEVFAQLLPLETIYLMTVSQQWPGRRAETLRQLAAFEHIWGRPQYKEPCRKRVNACGSDACYEVTKICFQEGTTHDPHFDGSSRKALSRLIRLFDKEEWSLSRLLELQQERVRDILDDQDEITGMDKREIYAIIDCLHDTVKSGGSN